MQLEPEQKQAIKEKLRMTYGPCGAHEQTIQDIVDNPKKILEFALVSGNAFSQGMATIAMAVFGTFADCEDVRRNLLRARSGK